MGPAQCPCKAPRTINILFHHLSQVCFQECLSYTEYKRGCKRSTDRCGSGCTERDPALPSSRQRGCREPPRGWAQPRAPARDGKSFLPCMSSASPAAQRSLLPARLRSAALWREENRQILAGARRSGTGPPRPRPPRPVTLAAERIPAAPARREVERRRGS